MYDTIKQIVKVDLGTNCLVFSLQLITNLSWSRGKSLSHTIQSIALATTTFDICRFIRPKYDFDKQTCICFCRKILKSYKFTAIYNAIS